MSREEREEAELEEMRKVGGFELSFCFARIDRGGPLYVDAGVLMSFA